MSVHYWRKGGCPGWGIGEKGGEAIQSRHGTTKQHRLCPFWRLWVKRVLPVPDVSLTCPMLYEIIRHRAMEMSAGL